MTVRAWFRLRRGQMWREHPARAEACHMIAAAILHANNPRPDEARERIYALVREDMERGIVEMRRILVTYRYGTPPSNLAD